MSIKFELVLKSTHLFFCLLIQNFTDFFNTFHLSRINNNKNQILFWLLWLINFRKLDWFMRIVYITMYIK